MRRPSHVSTNPFHGSARTSYAAPAGFGIVGEHRDVVAAVGETVGEHVRDTFDAAALVSRDRQPIADGGDAQAISCVLARAAPIVLPAAAAPVEHSCVRRIWRVQVAQRARARDARSAQSLAQRAIGDQLSKRRGWSHRCRRRARAVRSHRRQAPGRRRPRTRRSARPARLRLDERDAEGLGRRVRLAVDISRAAAARSTSDRCPRSARGSPALISLPVPSVPRSESLRPALWRRRRASRSSPAMSRSADERLQRFAISLPRLDLPTCTITTSSRRSVQRTPKSRPGIGISVGLRDGVIG